MHITVIDELIGVFSVWWLGRNMYLRSFHYRGVSWVKTTFVSAHSSRWITSEFFMTRPTFYLFQCHEPSIEKLTRKKKCKFYFSWRCILQLYIYGSTECVAQCRPLRWSLPYWILGTDSLFWKFHPFTYILEAGLAYPRQILVGTYLNWLSVVQKEREK